MTKQNLIAGLVALTVTLITIGGFSYFEQHSSDTIKVEHINAIPSKAALFSMDEQGEVVPLDFTKTAAKTLDAVVHIKSTQTSKRRGANERSSRNKQSTPDPFRDFFNSPQPRQNGPQVRMGTGSGVIINDKGYIITNNHVIADADDLEVTLHDNRVFKAKVVGADPATDLALIQIKAEKLPTVSLTNSDDIQVGEWVLAVGNPLGLNSTVTAGIVSAKGRSINILKEQFAVESFIQTDAAINPGNSGGALVNLQGGLVGINTAIASPTGSYSGYGFAVPSNIVNKVVEDLLAYGHVQRGVLGVMIRNVDGNFAKEKDLDLNTGVYVDSLLNNSAAATAGIQKGDIIIGVGEKEIKSSPQLQAAIAEFRPGDQVNIAVNRNGKQQQFEVTLNNREGGTNLISKEEKGITGLLGADLQNIDKAIARKLDLKGGIKVTKINPKGIFGKDTDMAEGFIITKVDNQPVTSKEDLVKILEGKKGGVLLEGVYEDVPGNYYYAVGISA